MKTKKNVVKASTRKHFYKDILKNDKKCLFYTNILTLDAFYGIFNEVKSFVHNRFHRKQKLVVPVHSVKKCTPCKSGKPRILDQRDEMLLTFMKLRLGLLFEDLADRFEISKSCASKIFQTWIRALSIALGSMIYMPDEENIRESTPARFQKYSRLNGIIDCSEIFIETPKNLELQSATWSEYKHHNTIKFLISVLPNSFINFVSEPYTGRISDKAIVNDTNFLNILPPYSTLMALTYLVNVLLTAST